MGETKQELTRVGRSSICDFMLGGWVWFPSVRLLVCVAPRVCMHECQ